MLFKLRLSVEGPLPRRRPPILEVQAGSWKTCQVGRAPEANSGSDPGRGSVAKRLFHRSLDRASRGRGDRKTFRPPVSPEPHVEAADRPGVELSEASEAGAGTQRGGDCPLEAVRVAPYKKRPHNLGPIWSSSMKADSCWFPTLPGPGRPGGRRPSCALLDVGPRSLPSRRSAFLQSESGWFCMRGSIPARTSDLPKWPTSSGTSCDTSPGPWSCCGTVGASTVPTASKNCWIVTRVCIPILSPATPLNSTRMSSSGHSLSEPSPTVFPRIWATSSNSSNRPSNDCADPSGSCGLASVRLNCPGLDVPITYA